MCSAVAKCRFNGHLHILQDEPIPSHQWVYSTNELVDLMERLVPVGESTDCATAVTGEPYVEFAVGARIHDLPEESVDKLLVYYLWQAFSEYLGSVQNPVLYWRMKPESYTFDRNDGFDSLDSKQAAPDKIRVLYMRYLLSSKGKS